METPIDSGHAAMVAGMESLLTAMKDGRLWSAWMTLVELGNALVAAAGALRGGASPNDSHAPR